MTHIHIVPPNEAEGDAAAFYAEAGTAPILQCFSPNPAFGRLINDAANLIHFSDGQLSRRDHEAIATYVSGLNRCPF
jgi:hypothetical protein